MKLQQLRRIHTAYDYDRTSVTGQSSFSKEVLRWLTSLSVHCSTGAERMGYICAVVERHSCAGLARGSVSGSPVWVRSIRHFGDNLACSDFVDKTGLAAG